MNNAGQKSKVSRRYYKPHTCHKSTCEKCALLKKQRRNARNGRERFRTIKSALAFQELRRVLPSNPNPHSKNDMTNVQVLRNAIRYIQILQETLAINNPTQEIAAEMQLHGFFTSAEEFLADETKLQQDILEKKNGTTFIYTLWNNYSGKYIQKTKKFCSCIR